jgi:TatD DNase family protein
MARWIDTHCHLDAAEFESDRDQVVQRARDAGVSQIVLPAVAVSNFDAVRALAHRHCFAYALGIHPLAVDAADEERDLRALHDALAAQRDDPRLVAVGEIGLDHFVPGLDRAKQERMYAAQLSLARTSALPVIVHVRRSADTLLKHLRRADLRGIAHAFNGSEQQAQVFIELGFKLGFGGAMTFDRALQIRRLAQSVPGEAIVLETDAPDIPPHWLYRTAAQRAAGERARNEPAQLPRIAATLAELRGWSLDETAATALANAHAALPRLAALPAGEA